MTDPLDSVGPGSYLPHMPETLSQDKLAALSDAELIDAAFVKWSDIELQAGREPDGSRFAREVLIRDPRQLRRWRAGHAELPVMLREWCRTYLSAT